MYKITISVTLIISQLFLITSCNDSTMKPLSLSSKVENKVVKIAKNRNIPSLELTITTNNDVINIDYNHKDVEKQTIYGDGGREEDKRAVIGPGTGLGGSTLELIDGVSHASVAEPG